MTRLAAPVAAEDRAQAGLTRRSGLSGTASTSARISRKSRHGVDRLVRAYADHLHFVFRRFPLVDIHLHARAAAPSAEAAAAQGALWTMHEYLLEQQYALTDVDHQRYAIELKLDTNDSNTTKVRPTSRGASSVTSSAVRPAVWRGRRRST